MFNPYGVIAVNPKKYPQLNYEGAMAFVDWITSPEGQKAIADFKVNGEQLFFPSAPKR
jgi:tungstate transport system substrate-binding protein